MAQISIRTYLEEARATYTGEGPPKSAQRVEAPTGVAIFPAEAPIPEEWANRMANVKRFTNMPKGGHFAALEVPDLWVNELRTFFYELQAP